MPKPSQKSLGLVRDILSELDPVDEYSFQDYNAYWKNMLFDFGFTVRVLDVFIGYSFNWATIIPALYVGEIGTRYTTLLPNECETVLENLIHFALENPESEGAPALRRSLTADGIELETSQVDSKIPDELRQLPGLESLQNDLKEHIRQRSLVAVLFMDLDNFKTVNDRAKCLIRVVKLISAAVLRKGKLYRRSGDEFVAVLPNFDVKEAAAVAERIRASIDEGNPGGAVKVTVSIGVVTSQSEGVTDEKSAITKADDMMYIAKATRNCVAACQR